MEILFLIALIAIATMGFFFYGKNLIEHEGSDFYLLPWSIFAFLALLDCLNITLSSDVTLIEYVAGIIMFIGPTSIAILVVRSMWKNLQKRDKTLLFILKVLKKEINSSFTQVVMLSLGVCLMVTLFIVEYHTSWGSSILFEYGVAIATILLDLVAITSLKEEIQEESEKFERTSWSCWFIAAAGVFFINGEWFSVASFLILENILISLLVMWWIHTYQKR